MAIRHSITLSTTEPNNEVGIIKIRQADEQTQMLDVQITENGVPKSFKGLQPFFCAKLGQSTGLGIIEQKVTGPINAEAGKLEYTMQAEDWQRLGVQTAYFSFRRPVNDHEYSEQFTTRDFNYTVTKNVFSEGITEVKKDGSTYVWTFEDLLRLFRDFISQGENQMLDFEYQWQAFVNANKEILESLDPGGELLRELIDSREPESGIPYQNLRERLNEADKKIIKASETLQKIQQSESKDIIFKNLEGGMHQYLIDFYNTNKNNILDDGSIKINLINDLHAQRSVYTEPAKEHGESATLGYQYLLMHGLFSKHVDFTLVNGDQIHGREPIDICKERNKLVKSICDLYNSDVYYNLGNHEDGDCYKTPKTRNNLITKQELMDIYAIDSYNRAIVFNDKKLKILLISVYDNPETFVSGVNIYPRDQYSVVSDDTFNFVKSELESTPSDYVVLSFAHNVIGNNDSEYFINHGALKKLFTNFNNSTAETIKSGTEHFPINSAVDFTNKVEGRFIGIIGGHRHKDVYDNSRGWHDITRTCQVCSDVSGTTPMRILGTATELITDIVNVDTAHRRLFIQRFGYGESIDVRY